MVTVTRRDRPPAAIKLSASPIAMREQLLPELADALIAAGQLREECLSHALAKLGVATRRELAAEADRHAGWRLRIEDAGPRAQQRQPALEEAQSPAIDADGT